MDQYAAAARTIADALHKQGVKVYAGLILPWEVNHLFPPEREALRRAINRWIAEEGPSTRCWTSALPSRTPTTAWA